MGGPYFIFDKPLFRKAFKMNIHVLDDEKRIREIDRSDMFSLVLDFPRQLEEAVEIGVSSPIDLNIDHIDGIMVTGLGGSAIGGDLLRGYLAHEIYLPIFVNRNYSLPEFVGCSTLVFASSYSGNTEETVAAYQEAVKRGAEVICLTTGGKLGALAREDGKPVVSLPSGFPPRTALGYLFVPMLIILSKVGLIEDKQVELNETVELLTRKLHEYGPAIPTSQNPAKLLAQKLYRKLPIIYASSDCFDVVTIRWKTQLAENSKMLAYCSSFPELNHNEIVGWEGAAELLSWLEVVVLRDKGDHPRIRKRMEITKGIIESEGGRVTEVWSEGDSLLARLFSLIWLGDFVSLYLAVLNGVDPTSIAKIDYLKQRLAEEG